MWDLVIFISVSLDTLEAIQCRILKRPIITTAEELVITKEINMNISIRQELPEDHMPVFKVIQNAFEKEKYSDHMEQFLVKRLRDSDAFIPELSLVAEINNEIVGHILLTRIQIINDKKVTNSLALAPVSVLATYQKKGVGAALINYAHKRALELGHGSIVLLGHETYYPKFGYKQADSFGIQLPFDVPKENCMAIELYTDALQDVSGVVAYDSAFS